MITYSSDYACAPMMWGAFRALLADGAEQVSGSVGVDARGRNLQVGN